MEKNISAYEEYVEKVVRIINESGIAVSAFGETMPDGSIIYGMIVTEDPNSSFRATIGLPKPEELAGDYIDAETYASVTLKELSEKESPVRLAVREFEKNNYDDIKDRIVPCVMNMAQYRDYIKNVPNRVFLDFAIVYVFNGTKTSLTVTNSIAEKLGVTEEKLYEDSVKNIVPKGPVSITRIIPEAELKAKGMVNSDGILQIPLYVVSDDEMMFGANAMLLPDFLEEVSKKLNGDFYVMIGNKSLLFVIPRGEGELALDEMKEMAKSAARMIFDQVGLLSDNVYSYSSQSREIQRV